MSDVNGDDAAADVHVVRVDFFLAPKSACSTRYYCIIKQIEQ